MKQWLKRIFYIPKHSKPTDENILRLLMPSVVGIAICMVCLASSTWAWFSTSVQTMSQTITAANYDMSVTVNDELVSVPIELKEGENYKIKLTATGTADKFGGYCVITGGGKPLYTTQIFPGGTPLTFIFSPDATAKYTFTAVWGKYSGEADITDGYTIGQAQPDTGTETSSLPTDTQNAAEHVVQSGDTLWEIALAYDTTVEELAAYNDISNPASLQIGQTIKIQAEEKSAPSSTAPSALRNETAAPQASAGSTEGTFDGTDSNTAE